jgi:hypothetical protein
MPVTKTAAVTIPVGDSGRASIDDALKDLEIANARAFKSG